MLALPLGKASGCVLPIIVTRTNRAAASVLTRHRPAAGGRRPDRSGSVRDVRCGSKAKARSPDQASTRQARQRNLAARRPSSRGIAARCVARGRGPSQAGRCRGGLFRAHGRGTLRRLQPPGLGYRGLRGLRNGISLPARPRGPWDRSGQADSGPHQGCALNPLGRRRGVETASSGRSGGTLGHQALWTRPVAAIAASRPGRAGHSHPAPHGPRGPG